MSTEITASYQGTELANVSTESMQVMSSGDTFDETGLAKIEEGLKTHARNIKAFGRTNTQATSKLLSLTMLASGPWRRLRQCGAEIDKRKMALAENQFNVRRKLADIELKKAQLDALHTELIDAELASSAEVQSTNDKHRPVYEIKHEITMLEIDLEEINNQLYETRRHGEGAMKDIAAIADAYEQIRVANGIPENWDEEDYQKGEMADLVMEALELAFADMIERRSLSRSAINYLIQLGIHPFAATKLIERYLTGLESNWKIPVYGEPTTDGDNTTRPVIGYNYQLPPIEHYYGFIDEHASMLGEGYKAALQRIGITNLVTDYAIWRDPERQAEREAANAAADAAMK